MTRKHKTLLEKNQFHLQDVNFVFSIGDEIDPPWDVMKAALKRIDTGGYQELVPIYADRDMLYNGTYEQIAWLLPEIVRGIDRGFDTGRYNLVEDTRLVGIGYILVWYWHRSLGGPRPSIRRIKGTQHNQVKWHADLECPFCHRQYVPPKAYKNWDSWDAEKRFKAWLRWLPVHAKTYHKWDF